ncbi:unnamed protein product [Phyllotreta striolata]|uniref:Elongation of very long chain fatty acids protein n=1 Tax=Phyllotreta striolata TaxID=444603 RepID=A0A9N9U1K4_PHYSR|nr:unnamed protein product [Phyllotreta striolata]
MMDFLWNIKHEVDDFFDKQQDTRVADWFMMSSIFPTLGIVFSYILFVKVIGPKLMEKRKPFNIKNILIVYNLFQVIMSTWIFYEVGMGGWFTGEYSWKCQPIDYSNKPSTLRLVRASYWYLVAKYIDLLDTIFFVLTKKNSHISVLHVIHHGIMPVSIWMGMKLFISTGHGTFFGLLNSFIHMIMYTYYLLSAMGPSIQKYLWWKKHLTALQIAQFVAIIVHTFQLFFRECDFPRFFTWYILLHGVMFLFLFKQFYEQAYNKNKKPEGVKTDDRKGILRKEHNFANGSKVSRRVKSH